MAGGKKKKTKPASNPTRGFATTSVPKAANRETNPSESNKSLASVEIATPHIAESPHGPVSANSDGKPSTDRELHELSPEELEAQLETADLQMFVEENATRIRKDVARQVLRLETDRRVLRGQADPLSLHTWLPEELMQLVVDQTLADHERSVDQQPSNHSYPTGDELVSKVWALRSCLLALDFSAERINAVLAALLSKSPHEQGSGLMWGLSFAFDWLALHGGDGELQYEVVKPRTPNLEDEFEDHDENQLISSDSARHFSISNAPDGGASLANDQDLEVSDVPSDAEPDELLETYLRTKAKLFELNEDLVDHVGKQATKRGKRATAPPQTTGEKKLMQKLHKIESDMLFNQQLADEQWTAKRISLARELSDRKKLQLINSEKATGRSSNVRPATPSNAVSEEAERLGREALEESDDEDNMLSGMFDALPGISQASATDANGNIYSTSVRIRDFGRLTGMNPKRVLEECCKSRDAGVRLTYKLVSPTTYASRHSLQIQWSKDQETVDAASLAAIRVQSKPRVTIFTAIDEATPDTAQSEAYIATVALFAIFSGSPKEEKAHLRLPPAFRDLWDELVKAKLEYVDSVDRETVKTLRALIDQNKQPTDEVDDEVVFNAELRQRSAANSGRATPQMVDQATLSATSETLTALWASKSSTPSYQKMLPQRRSLPIFQHRDAILDRISENKVTILVSETGSGKSTQLPAYILEHELSHGRECKVYCTEPRRISAISLAQRVSEEMGERKGDVGSHRSLVGYAIRLESQITSSTRLVYATTGIVLRMLENAEGLRGVTHLVIDEVHERSIDTDFLLIIIRSMLQKKTNLKVVLMSATVNAQRFSDYFDNAPIVDVPGRTFPVQAKFLEDAVELVGDFERNMQYREQETEAGDSDSPDPKTEKKQLIGYSKRTAEVLANYDEYLIDYPLILKLLEKVSYDPRYRSFSKAILIFLPGIAEIRQLTDMLAGHSLFSPREWRVYPLHSSFASEDQQAAFEIPPHGVRKIVLATNIAETGITIPDVTCVIDTGKHKEMRFDERRQMSRLIMSFISRANAKQRRGRAGRVQEGICFHLFTKYRHDELMPENQTPEMLRLSLQELVMRVKICNLSVSETSIQSAKPKSVANGVEAATGESIVSVLSAALDPPSIRNIRRAIDALIEVGALTSAEELTPLGQQIAKLPLDAPLSKLVLLGSIFGCLDFALTAAGALTSKSPFLSPMHAKKQADTVRLGFKRGDSDLLTLYQAYLAWRKVCQTPGMSEYQFCNKNFLSPQNLSNIEDLKGQLLTALVEAGFVALGADERTALAKVRPGSRQRRFIVLPSQYCTADLDDHLISSVVAWSFYPKIVKQEGKGWRSIANNQSLTLHPASVNKVGLPPSVTLLSFYSVMQSSSRSANAQETTPAPEMALVLFAGDAVFNQYAGVVVIDGNRLKYKVKDWKTLFVLKTLRTKLREAMARLLKYPGKELTGKHKMWMELVMRMFEHQRKVKA